MYSICTQPETPTVGKIDTDKKTDPKIGQQNDHQKQIGKLGKCNTISWMFRIWANFLLIVSYEKYELYEYGCVKYSSVLVCVLASNATLFIKLGLCRNMSFGCVRYSSVLSFFFASDATLFIKLGLCRNMVMWDIAWCLWFLASNATQRGKHDFELVGKILHQGLMRSWLSVDNWLMFDKYWESSRTENCYFYFFFSSNGFLSRFLCKLIDCDNQVQVHSSEHKWYESFEIWKDFHFWQYFFHICCKGGN